MAGGKRRILVLFLDTARALISAWPQASPYSGQNLWSNRDRTGRQDLGASLIRRSGRLAAGRQLPSVQNRGLEEKRGKPERVGRGVSWRRRRGKRSRHPHRISPRKAVAEARLSRTAGGPRATWGTGGDVPSCHLPGVCTSDRAGGRRPRSGVRAKGVCPTPAAAQGSGTLLHGKHVCSRLQGAAESAASPSRGKSG